MCLELFTSRCYVHTNTASMVSFHEDLFPVSIVYDDVFLPSYLCPFFSSFFACRPEPLQIFFDVQGTVSTIGQHLVNPDCTTSLSPADLFYSKQFAYLIFPIVLTCIVYIIWKTYARVTGNEWSRHDSKKTKVVHNGQVRSSRIYVNVKDRFVVTFCVLIYLLYPTLSKQAFGLFTCIEVNGKSYLLADLEEECYVGQHTTFVILVGIPQLLIFVVGLPFIGLYFLYRNRYRLNTMPVKARYGLFFGGYKSDRYFWEIFLIFRKISVIAISSFGAAMDAEMQSLLLLMVLVLCSALQHIGQPYDTTVTRLLQNLELAVLFMLTATLWSGLIMFKLNESGKESSKSLHLTLTIVTVLANVGFAITLVVILLRQMILISKHIQI